MCIYSIRVCVCLLSTNVSFNSFTGNSPHTLILQGTSCTQAVSHTLKRKYVFPPQGNIPQQVRKGQSATFHPQIKHCLQSFKLARGTQASTHPILPIKPKSSPDSTSLSHSKGLNVSAVEDEHQRVPTTHTTAKNETEKW